MATATPSAPADGAEAHTKLTCSHSGRLHVPLGRGGVARYEGGAAVRAVRHLLADDEGVVVSVTCDEELAHMLDEYDRLRATQPSAAFRVFVFTTTTGSSGGAHRPRRAAAGLPPLPPKKMRRVQSAHEVAGSRRLPPSFHQHQNRRDVRAPAAAATRPMQTAPDMSKNATGVRSGSQERAPVVAAAAKAAARGVFTISPHLVCC